MTAAPRPPAALAAAAPLVRKALFYLLVAAIVVFAVFPFYYAILSSLKAGTSCSA